MPRPVDSPEPSLSILPLTAQFISERQYLHGVSPKTVEWYNCPFRAFEPYLSPVTNEDGLRAALRGGVMKMAEAGNLLPTSINDYSRCLNAFLKWLREEGHITHTIKIPKLKVPEKVPELLSDKQVAGIIQFRAKKKIERRIHMMLLMILDTGMRVNEVLNVRKQDIDLDNLLITVQKGKGSKQRIVPMSLSFRKVIFKFLRTEPHPRSEYVFSTRDGAPQTYRNAVRTLKDIGKSVGAPNIRFHLLRHQWATHYLRSGGSVALLRKQLGHADLSTVLTYEHIASSDLLKVHERHSLLAAISS